MASSLKLVIVLVAVTTIGVAVVLVERSPAQSAAPTSERYGDLIAKAERNGYVRVIVELKDSYHPIPGSSAQAEDTARRDAVAQVQDDLLEKLKGYNAVVTARLANVPAIGLKVDAPALRALASWPAVVSITEDQPMAPLGF